MKKLLSLLRQYEDVTGMNYPNVVIHSDESGSLYDDNKEVFSFSNKKQMYTKLKCAIKLHKL